MSQKRKVNSDNSKANVGAVMPTTDQLSKKQAHPSNFASTSSKPVNKKASFTKRGVRTNFIQLPKMDAQNFALTNHIPVALGGSQSSKGPVINSKGIIK